MAFSTLSYEEYGGEYAALPSDLLDEIVLNLEQQRYERNDHWKTVSGMRTEIEQLRSELLSVKAAKFDSIWRMG